MALALAALLSVGKGRLRHRESNFSTFQPGDAGSLPLAPLGEASASEDRHTDSAGPSLSCDFLRRAPERLRCIQLGLSADNPSLRGPAGEARPRAKTALGSITSGPAARLDNGIRIQPAKPSEGHRHRYRTCHRVHRQDPTPIAKEALQDSILDILQVRSRFDSNACARFGLIP